MAIRGFLNLNVSLKIPKAVLFTTMSDKIVDDSILLAFKTIDKYKFGPSGLKAVIDAQDWEPLSPSYFNWKASHIGKAIEGEPRPNVVISTKIWIRTGKVLKAATTVGNKGDKTITLQADPPKYEAILDPRLAYYIWAEEKRPLFFWTEDDLKRIPDLVKAAMDETLARGGWIVLNASKKTATRLF